MKVSVILIFILISSLSVYPQRDVDALIEYMVGSFSNKEQAVKDSDYFNIEIEIVQIWKDRTDGPWVYVEQAVAEKKEKPYSQRVYQIKQRSDGKIESIIYSIPDPTRFAGDYKKDFPLMRLIPDSLILLPGCEVVLNRTDDGYFEGGTNGKNCSNNFRDSSYVTSEVIIDKDRMISWDREFDENGKQVLGPNKGGYIFKKKLNRLQKRY